MKYIVTESQTKFLIKKFFKKDFSEKIELIQFWDDLPFNLKGLFGDKKVFNYYLNNYGPIFVILVGGTEFLVQYRDGVWIIVNESDLRLTEFQFMDLLGISPLGITLQEFIDTYYSE